MFDTNAMDHFFKKEEPIETTNASNGRSAQIDATASNGTFITIIGDDVPEGQITLQADFDAAVFIANALLAHKA